MAKKQFNIFIEHEYIDILEAYAQYLMRKKKIQNIGRAGYKTEAFREAMRFIRLSHPLENEIIQIEKAHAAVSEPQIEQANQNDEI